MVDTVHDIVQDRFVIFSCVVEEFFPDPPPGTLFGAEGFPLGLINAVPKQDLVISSVRQVEIQWAVLVLCQKPATLLDELGFVASNGPKVPGTFVLLRTRTAVGNDNGVCPGKKILRGHEEVMLQIGGGWELALHVTHERCPARGLVDVIISACVTGLRTNRQTRLDHNCMIVVTGTVQHRHSVLVAVGEEALSEGLNIKVAVIDRPIL